MAVELSYTRGSISEVVKELGIEPGRISKWRQRNKAPQQPVSLQLTEEQKEIRRLQKELKEAQLKRDILDPMLAHVCWYKKAASIFSERNRKY
jgi:transposase